MKLSLVSLVIAIVLGKHICTGVPVFQGFPAQDYLTVYESFQNGSVLFNFTVTGTPDITNVFTDSYDTEQLVELERSDPGPIISVSVITKNIFDRDGHGNVGHPGSGSVKLSFRAEDRTGNVVRKDLTVYISDINDNAPILKNIPYTWEIPERNANTTVYTEISADDYDNGDNGIPSLRYSIEPNTQSVSAGEEYLKMFGINEISGQVSLKNDILDYETNSFYQFSVIVKDQKGAEGCNNNTADLIIKILDVQDTPPYFVGIPYRKTISEEKSSNMYVLTVSAIDGDRGVPNNVNYTIRQGTCSKLFNISEDGNICTAEVIDRDTGDVANVSGVCVLTIVAQEIDGHPEKQFGNTTATTTVTISISDENDNPPKFNVNATYEATIQENTPKSVPITLSGVPTEILVEDADEGNNARVSLSLIYPNGSTCEDFYATPAIIQKSGSTLIRVNSSTMLDYEERKNITFLIQATDSANHTVNATVLLHIEDMNDNNPQFENISYEFSIPENSVPGTTVGVVTAHDKDSGLFGEVTYALYGGDDRFHIDYKTGDITTMCRNCNASLDREKNSIIFMTLTATDFNGTVGGRSNSTSLVINLTDVNDNPPQFLSDQYSATVAENDIRYNSTNGVAILQVTATDKDEENTNNSRIQYSIDHIEEDLLPCSNFSLNSTTGELFLATPLDFEELLYSSGRVHIVIHAIDFGDPSLTGTSTVVLQVQDVNDEMPVFEVPEYIASIEENATSSVGDLTNVTRVYASDADGSEPNKKIQYFIMGGAWSDFAINSSTGDVSVQINRNLNRDVRPSYNITIIAIDMGSPPLTGTTTLSVDIVDVNDKAPVFDPKLYTTSVLENQTVFEEGVNLNATDTDSNHKLEYDITDIEAWDENGVMVNRSKVKDYFKIGKTNGSIYINAAPDREVAKTITLTVIVKDVNAFFPPLQNDTATVTLTIEDINDNPPLFEPQDYTVNVSENAQDPTILLTVKATDRDENRTILYDIVSVEPNVTSFIIHAETGVLSKRGELDRETHACLMVLVSATDNGYPPLTSTATVNVTVLDFNDNAPQFPENTTKTVYVLENATMYEEVLTVQAEDKDEGVNALVRYEIESGDSEKFRINKTLGNISVNGNLDRETMAEYTLVIKAMDSPVNVEETKEARWTVTIHIHDVNDNAPEFPSTQFSMDILENVKVDTSVITISASDKDEPNTNNSQVSYSFRNNTEGLFRIDDRSGVIFVNKSLIGHIKSHTIELIATDHGNPALHNNESSTVNITVYDVNLNNPVLVDLPPDYTIKFPECVDVGFDVYMFNYTDADHGRNAEAYFNISEIDTESLPALDTFEIDHRGQLKTTKKLDASERHEYKFHIQVTDRGVPPLLSDKVTITVIVTDVDDNLPAFSTNKTTMSVEENKPPGTVVGTVTAHDIDRDSISCYIITDSDASSFFNIGKQNGSIVTTHDFDYEKKSMYKFHVKVSDCSIVQNITECGNVTYTKPVIIDSIEVTVNVVDMNDNAPYFRQDEFTVGMRRVTEVGVSLDLSLKSNDSVGDKDTVSNGRLVWVFNNSAPLKLSDSLKDKLEPEGVDACEDGIKHLVCVTGNGTLINNKYYSEDMSGYLIVPVGVRDEAGSDLADIKIFLISDSQILIMTLYGRKETIAEKKNEIMDLYSTITGYEFVYDWVEDHKTPDGKVETYKTDLYFHVVDTTTQAILSTIEAIRVVDEFYDDLIKAVEQYQVLSIVSSVALPPEEVSPYLTVYIMAAVIAVLVMTVIIVVYVSMTTRNRYRTKLKAATVKPQDITQKHDIGQAVIPGSNIYCKLSNPLLDAELPLEAEYDNLSMGSQNSLDKNDVGIPIKEGTGLGLEEREVTLDMFTEDTCVAGEMESPLDEALRLHEQEKSKRLVDLTDTTAFDNYTYEDEFESTEI